MQFIHICNTLIYAKHEYMHRCSTCVKRVIYATHSHVQNIDICNTLACAIHASNAPYKRESCAFFFLCTNRRIDLVACIQVFFVGFFWFTNRHIDHVARIQISFVSFVWVSLVGPLCFTHRHIDLVLCKQVLFESLFCFIQVSFDACIVPQLAQTNLHLVSESLL